MIATTVHNFVGGKTAESNSSEQLEVVNPATGEVIGNAPLSTADDVDAAVRAARSAFPDWRDATPRERATTIVALADLLADNADELSRLESANAGKPRKASLHELEYTVDELHFLAGASRALEGLSTGEYMRGYTSMLRREPIGVVGHIDPWNYPLMISITKAVQALLVGNTVVVKPSELTPLPLLRAAELASGILPAGVLNVICGRGVPVGEAIAAHPGIGLVNVTGSFSTGVAVSQRAAETVKPTHMELGGGAPVIVFDDADPEAVARSLRLGAFYNTGQDCGAAARVLAGNSIFDRVLEALMPEVEAVDMAAPLERDDVEMGPVISTNHQQRVLGYVERAVDGGATLLAGGEASRSGAFVAPTVVVDVAQEDEIVQDEVFGPVITAQRVSDEAEALAWANGTSAGLAASVFTRDVGRALRCSRLLEHGTVWINDHLPVITEMPWGGFKGSGHGKEHSIYGLLGYTRVKHVMARLD